MPNDAELKLLKYAHSKNYPEARIARQALINANYRLIVTIARKHAKRDIDFADLFQAGIVGFNRAIDKLGLERSKFSTSAAKCIEQAIIGCASGKTKIVKIYPTLIKNSQAKIKKIQTKEKALLKEYGRKPTAEEIAEALGGKKAGFDPQSIRFVIQASTHPGLKKNRIQRIKQKLKNIHFK